MTGYEPKAGDKIRVIPKPIDGVVVKVTGDGQVLLDHMRPTLVSAWPQRDHFHPSKYDFELIEAAPVPFEVGKPLTAEMGEPPIGSSVTYLTGGKQLRYTDTWIHTATGWRDGDGSMMEWQYFAAAISGGVLVLDRLGVGQ